MDLQTQAIIDRLKDELTTAYFERDAANRDRDSALAVIASLRSQLMAKVQVVEMENPDPDAVIEGIIIANNETERCRELSNDALVDEILNRLPFTELDFLIEEACTRLSPEWVNRGAPERGN